MPAHSDSPDLERVIPELCRRLRRIAGQAQGIERMLLTRRECGEIVTQVAAMKAAVEQVGISLVSCLLEDAIREALRDGHDSSAAVEQARELLRRV